MVKVVARFVDGHVLKGKTADFAAGKAIFHVASAGEPGAPAVDVKTNLLKALFFVKDFDGDPSRVDNHDHDTTQPALGKWVRAVFCDGEVLVGTTRGYRPDLPGFFVVPGDSDSNIERCYVIVDNMREIRFL